MYMHYTISMTGLQRSDKPYYNFTLVADNAKHKSMSIDSGSVNDVQRAHTVHTQYWNFDTV